MLSGREEEGERYKWERSKRRHSELPGNFVEREREKERERRQEEYIKREENLVGVCLACGAQMRSEVLSNFPFPGRKCCLLFGFFLKFINIASLHVHCFHDFI